MLQREEKKVEYPELICIAVCVYLVFLLLRQKANQTTAEGEEL